MIGVVVEKVAFSKFYCDVLIVKNVIKCQYNKKKDSKSFKNKSKRLFLGTILTKERKHLKLKICVDL